ncbi:MAG TPA: TetR/AcrR family transcriptional regulator [Candidatus Ligilactobacillus excrementavium]|nr:TetR/AcrR family transcriptional regulator [Candidatus Ligilactobacillus excrementavium]
MSQTQKRTKREIILSLFDLLETNSFANITVNQICETAMIHRSTFYRYFNDKFDLAENLLEELADRLSREANKNQRDTLAEIDRFLVENLHLVQNLIPDQYSKFFPEFSRILEDLITSRLKEKDLQNDMIVRIVNESAYPELMVSFITNSVMGVLTKLFENPSKENMQQVKNFLFETFQKLI